MCCVLFNLLIQNINFHEHFYLLLWKRTFQGLFEKKCLTTPMLRRAWFVWFLMNFRSLEISASIFSWKIFTSKGWNCFQWYIRSSCRRCSLKKLFWKILENSHENTCTRLKPELKDINFVNNRPFTMTLSRVHHIQVCWELFSAHFRREHNHFN